MLKAQDIVILLKMLSTMTLSKGEPEELLSQNKLATLLCMSASEVNAGIKRLVLSGLLGPVLREDPKIRISTPDVAGIMPLLSRTEGLLKGRLLFLPVKTACEECLISAVKYFFPIKLGAYTRGIATSYAAPIFEKQILIGDDPIPVWPHGEGNHRGWALEPLYRSVPNSLIQYPDQLFYEFLVLVDALRSGRVRERNIAIKLLKEKIYA